MPNLANLLPSYIKNPRRVKFTVEIEVDLDRVPGWGYQVEDFHDHVVKHLEQEPNVYNIKALVIP